MESVQFRVTVPAWAVDELLADPIIRTHVRTTTDTWEVQRKDAFQLGLAEAAQIMSIVVGSTKLVELAMHLAKKLASLGEEAHRRRQHLRVMVQTGADDVLLDVERCESEQLAQTIAKIASRD